MSNDFYRVKLLNPRGQAKKLVRYSGTAVRRVLEFLQLISGLFLEMFTYTAILWLK